MTESQLEKYQRLNKALENRRDQIEAVAQVLVNNQTDLSKFLPPQGIHPSRWRAMIRHAINCGLPQL